MAPVVNRLPLADYNWLLFTIKSPPQLQLLNSSRPNYLRFFESDQLPEPQQLPPIYFLEDLQLPRESFSESKRQRTTERLRRLFTHYVYGYAPEIPEINIEKLSERILPLTESVRAEVLELSLHLALPKQAKGTIRLILFRPVGLGNINAPLILASNHCGNHLLVAPGLIEKVPPVFEHEKCREPGFLKTHTDKFWSVDQLIERGYSFASFHDAEVAPDDEKLFRTALMSHYTDAPFTDKNSWGAVAAWAWGLRIAAKALLQAELATKGQISVFGHSRRGKAALWAAANDENLSQILAHQSGTLGSALTRNHLLISRSYYKKNATFELFPRLGSQQESLSANDFLFPHWFASALKDFHNQEERLPVDQHLLFALLAPRLVIDSQGLQDRWSNYESALVAVQFGLPYYEYLSGAQKDERALTALQLRLNEKHLMTRQYWTEILGLLPR